VGSEPYTPRTNFLSESGSLRDRRLWSQNTNTFGEVTEQKSLSDYVQLYESGEKITLLLEVEGRARAPVSQLATPILAPFAVIFMS